MRMVRSITSVLLLVAACDAPAPQTGNAIATNGPFEANVAVAESSHNDRQLEPATTQPQANACQTQDGHSVTHKLKAIGTEPFWAAQVEGRCVTYSTPEDQAGTRVWTKVSDAAPATVWNGALHNKQFQLTVRPNAGCSDGMSDKVYPLDAVLQVEGKTRRGCAEPL